MMKKITQKTLKTSLTVTALCLGIQLSAQTFDWENATDNGNNATQTINGVTATVTTNIITTITDNISVLNLNGLAGTSGSAVFNGLANNSNSFTVSFSSPIDISTFFAFDADQITGSTWTFTPTGGNNTPIVQAIQNNQGSTITANWTNVNSFTITSAQVNDTFGVDNINFTTTLSTNDFNVQNSIEIFPNPSSDYLNISNLKTETKFQILNILGSEVMNGIIKEGSKIGLHELESGVYFLKLGNNNSTSIKFIKK